MYEGLAQLLRARRGHDALAAGAPRTLLADAPAGVLALARGERFLTLFNFSATPQQYPLDGAWRDVVTPGLLTGTLTLAPYALHWLVRE
jgi:amylosucrase